MERKRKLFDDSDDEQEYQATPSQQEETTKSQPPKKQHVEVEEEIKLDSPKKSSDSEEEIKFSSKSKAKKDSPKNDFKPTFDDDVKFEDKEEGGSPDEMKALASASASGALEGNENTSNFEEDNFDYSVSHPKLIGDSVVYMVKGVDKIGKWEGQRRYSHFNALYNVLLVRFPACYIPKLPPKKTLGNKEIAFIKERRYYLERFLRKLANYDFIINAEEFQMFSRPNGDVEKLLHRLTKMPTVAILDRLRKACDINERMYDMEQKEKFSNVSVDGLFFIKKVLPQLKGMKKTIENFKGIKDSQISNYKVLYRVLDNYEEINMMTYTEKNPRKLIITEPDSKDIIKDQMAHLIENLKNPFDDMYHWCKGEIYDLQALQTALQSREQIEGQIKKLEGKKKNTQTDLENVNTGKKTIRTLLKGDKDTNGMLNTIEVSEREIDSLQQLFEVITINLGETVIPKFKDEKLKIYSRVMQQFNIMEINNAHQTASFWSKILSNPQLKALSKAKV